MKKLLFLDVDGTLTDGKIYMGNQGEVFKAFDIKDGCGIHDILIPNKIIPVILTGRKSRIIENRCKEIGIDNIYQGITNKLELLNIVIDGFNSNLENVFYAGDDINDLKCMHAVKTGGGKVACPMDAVPEVIKIADFISAKAGGHGAVREICEWIVSICFCER